MLYYIYDLFSFKYNKLCVELEEELNRITEQRKMYFDELIEMNKKIYEIELNNIESKKSIYDMYFDLIKYNNDLKSKEKRINNIITGIAAYNKDVNRIFIDKYYSEEEKIWKISNFVYQLYIEEQKL